MSATSVVDQIGVYFGGPYDAAAHRYGTPQVTGLGAVRRGRPKDQDQAEYYLGMDEGTATGAICFIRYLGSNERRRAFAGAVSGGKDVAHDIVLTFWIRSTAPNAEDMQDWSVAFLDAVLEHIRADRTLGSGGLEVGGFHVGEDYDGPGNDLITTELSEAATSAQVSKQTLTVAFSASEYIQA